MGGLRAGGREVEHVETGVAAARRRHQHGVAAAVDVAQTAARLQRPARGVERAEGALLHDEGARRGGGSGGGSGGGGLYGAHTRQRPVLPRGEGPARGGGRVVHEHGAAQDETEGGGGLGGDGTRVGGGLEGVHGDVGGRVVVKQRGATGGGGVPQSERARHGADGAHEREAHLGGAARRRRTSTRYSEQ